MNSQEALSWQRRRHRRAAAARRALPGGGRAGRRAAPGAGAADVAGPLDDRAAQSAGRAGPHCCQRRRRDRPTLALGLGTVWDGTGQRREAHEWIQRTLAWGEPPATPGAVAGLAAASSLLQPWDDQAALELAQWAAQLASQLGDTERARAAAAVGMAAPYGTRPELALPALHQALALFGNEHPWERARALQSLALATAEPAEALGWARE